MRQCDPVLLFWLVEELLDSQTTSGCRRVLDFLESRHQRITANPSVAMQLTILRSCNELLRRLSRARDTTFCGRVFIFMFQSFPLGDRSSVNLRGEYHVENVTTFDQDPERNGTLDKMEIDDRTDDPTSSEAKPSATRPNAVDESIRRDMDALYPVFWSLQASFSQPKKLFDRSHFERFKSGLESTMAAFKDAQTKQISRSQRQEEDPRPGQKRKHEGEGADLTDAFNPKYLTSRDLFRLEASSYIPMAAAPCRFFSFFFFSNSPAAERSHLQEVYPGPGPDHNGVFALALGPGKRDCCRGQRSQQVRHLPGSAA